MSGNSFGGKRARAGLSFIMIERPEFLSLVGCSRMKIGIFVRFWVVAFCCLQVLGCPGCGKKLNDPKKTHYQSLRDEVITRLSNGSMLTDSSGIAILPTDLESASMRGL